MNPCHFLPLALLLGACAGPPEALIVKQFQLRDQNPTETDEPFVRMEKERRLRGAVSLAERKEKLGQYYTLMWSDPAGTGQGGVEVIFQYQQGASASRFKRMTRTFGAGESGGKAEFAVIGEDYFKNGRVLAWKATLQRDKRVIATKQSYLWQ